MEVFLPNSFHAMGNNTSMEVFLPFRWNEGIFTVTTPSPLFTIKVSSLSTDTISRLQERAVFPTKLQIEQVNVRILKVIFGCVFNSIFQKMSRIFSFIVIWRALHPIPLLYTRIYLFQHSTVLSLNLAIGFP